MQIVERSEISKEVLESIAAKHYIECEDEYKYVYELPEETAKQIIQVARIPVEKENWFYNTILIGAVHFSVLLHYSEQGIGLISDKKAENRRINKLKKIIYKLSDEIKNSSWPYESRCAMGTQLSDLINLVDDLQKSTKPISSLDFLVSSLVQGAKTAGGILVAHKEDSTGSLNRVLELLRPYLPEGIIPKAVELNGEEKLEGQSRIGRLAQKTNSARKSG